MDTNLCSVAGLLCNHRRLLPSSLDRVCSSRGTLKVCGGWGHLWCSLQTRGRELLRQMQGFGIVWFDTFGWRWGTSARTTNLLLWYWFWPRLVNASVSAMQLNALSLSLHNVANYNHLQHAKPMSARLRLWQKQNLQKAWSLALSGISKCCFEGCSIKVVELARAYIFTCTAVSCRGAGAVWCKQAGS